MLLSPGRFLEEDARNINRRGLAAILFALSLVFGVIKSLEFYVFAHAKLGYLTILPSQNLDMGDVSIRFGLTLAVLVFTFIPALSALLVILMRALGSRPSFLIVAKPAILLLPFPVVVTAFPTALNIITYLILGDVSVLNTSFTGAIGWMIYFMMVGFEAVQKSGLKGWRKQVAYLPAAILVVACLAWVAATIWFNYVYIGHMSENTLAATFGR
jgi:hypothetical protein